MKPTNLFDDCSSPAPSPSLPCPGEGERTLSCIYGQTAARNRWYNITDVYENRCLQKHMFPVTILTLPLSIETYGSENSLFFCLRFTLKHMLLFLPKQMTHNICLRNRLFPETYAYSYNRQATARPFVLSFTLTHNRCLRK